MLAMHYAIDLSDAGAVSAVRERAAQRGPLFDGMAGLGQKLFLIDAVRPCYATFYLWADADAALSFLRGDFFAALAQTFGRPKVKLLLTTATELPFPAGARLTLGQNGADMTPPVPVSALDPFDGRTYTLADDGKDGRTFEVMYRAIGAVGER